MPVHRPDVDRAVRPAARTMDIEPRRAGQNGGWDRRRPWDALAGSKRSIPALDDTLGLLACGLLLGAGPPSRWRIEMTCADLHGFIVHDSRQKNAPAHGSGA